MPGGRGREGWVAVGGGGGGLGRNPKFDVDWFRSWEGKVEDDDGAVLRLADELKASLARLF